MKTEVTGPYGLYEVSGIYYDSDAYKSPLKAVYIEAGEMTVASVTDATGKTVIDAFRDTPENKEEALQWLLDVACAATGLEGVIENET